MNRNRNSANFFSYACNGKKIKELLNGIPASVRCVSSMVVVLNAKFARLLAAHSNKNRREPKKPDISGVFCWLKHIDVQLLSQSLLCTQKNESILYFPTIYKANRNYTSMLGKSTHLAVIPQQSTQNTANLPLQTYEKNQ